MVKNFCFIFGCMVKIRPSGFLFIEPSGFGLLDQFVFFATSYFQGHFHFLRQIQKTGKPDQPFELPVLPSARGLARRLQQPAQAAEPAYLLFTFFALTENERKDAKI